jgi:ATP adenylyltransferase
MISPYLHTGTIEGLDEPTLLELMTLSQRSLAALHAAYRPEGFNVGFNLGKVAGAGFDDHVHLHVVPRWGADSNFMPVIGNARVLPELLEESYRALKAAWA